MRAVAQFQPWDFEGLDLEPALVKLADLGMDAISLGLIQPTVCAIRRTSTDGPRVIHQPAGFHFQPDTKAYASTRIKPVAAKWLRQRNPVERIVRAASEQNLRVDARIDLTDLSDTLERMPLAGSVNIFGEQAGTRLCPSNPDATAFIEATIEDVCQNYAFGRIELTGFSFANRLASDHAGGSPICNAVESHLLSLCFCPSCRDRAARDGVHIDRVVSAVHNGLDAQFRLEPPPDLTIETFHRHNPDVAAFEESRFQTTLALIANLRQRSKVRLAWRPGHDETRKLAAVVSEQFESIIVCGDAPPAVVCDDALPVAMTPDWDAAAWKQYRQPAGRIEVALRPTPPIHADSQSLIRHVKSLCAEGYTTLHFGPMGELPPPCQDWIRQAVRYAKRETTT